MSEVYVIAVTDNTSDLYTYGLPMPTDSPQAIYRSLPAALAAAATLSKKFDNFLPVSYGVAYPYEGVTLEQTLTSKSAAPYGWGILEDEDGDPQRVGIHILSFKVAA